MDIDNLQGITIYLVWALQRPSLIIDLFLISEFISDCTKKSVRTMYLDVLKASVDFLLDMDVDPDRSSLNSDSDLGFKIESNPTQDNTTQAREKSG